MKYQKGGHLREWLLKSQVYENQILHERWLSSLYSSLPFQKQTNDFITQENYSLKLIIVYMWTYCGTLFAIQQQYSVSFYYIPVTKASVGKDSEK